MLSHIDKWGNSLGVRIPSAFAKTMHIEAGGAIDISLDNGRIIITPAQRKLTLSDLLVDYPASGEEEILTGPARGAEVVEW